MGLMEGLALWAGASILFCIGVGKLLHHIDHLEARRAEAKLSEARSLVGLHPSQAHR